MSSDREPFNQLIDHHSHRSHHSLREKISLALERKRRRLWDSSRRNSLHPDSESRRNRGEGSGPVFVKMTIYKFNQEIEAKREVKVVTRRRVNPPAIPPKAINSPPTQDATAATDNETPQPAKSRVYRIGDIHTGSRCVMKHLGIDIGTRTVVLAYRDEEGTAHYISEINGYWPFERATPFIKNMLDDPNKVRSDGTCRPARWFEMPEEGQAVVIGQDAEEFAYAKNDTLHRPMAEGGIAADEEAMTVLSTIVQGLMEMAEKELGKFEKDVKVCYCTTAPAINKDVNIDYHERVVDIVIDSYETSANIHRKSIKESHAIVIDMSPDGTGIGISWGAGTVTVSYVKYGLEIFSFCWVGAGDWIDEQVAARHGYDPLGPPARRKKAKETPTTVSKRKMSTNLTPGEEPTDRVSLDVVLHYDVLISTVIDGIIKGFEENESEARLDGGAVNVYMSGGTSSPAGFVERCRKKFDEMDVPFEIGDVAVSPEPLYSVALGCLQAAEQGIVE